MKNCFALFAAVVLLVSCASSKGSLFEDTVAVEEGKEESEKEPIRRGKPEGDRESTWQTEEQEDIESDKGWSIQIQPKMPGIYITSNPPGADVYLNGSYRGITPIKIRTEQRGLYTLNLYRDGCLPLEDTIDYRGGSARQGFDQRRRGKYRHDWDTADQVLRSGSDCCGHHREIGCIALDRRG
jgi:hypothetical protein